MEKANRMGGRINHHRVSTVIFALLAALFVSGGCLMSEAAEIGDIGTAWFASPEEAVPAISRMLRREDFKTLATYYDLTGSDIDPATLMSDDFFIRRERPEVAHPGGFWRYKQPFAPGFTYTGMTADSTQEIYTIHLRIEIEQGEGVPPQIGLDDFRMIRSENGWQILPKAEEGKPAEMPVTVKPLPEPSWR